MLLSYNADLLPRVRMLGRINYTEPWIHFSRTIDEYVLYVIRDGNMYLQEDGIFYHLKAGDFFLLEPGLCHEGYQRAACNYYYLYYYINDNQFCLNHIHHQQSLKYFDLLLIICCFIYIPKSIFTYS